VPCGRDADGRGRIAGDMAAQIIGIAIEIEVQSGAGTEFAQLARHVEPTAQRHQRRHDRGGAPDFVGLRRRAHPFGDMRIGGVHRRADDGIEIAVQPPVQVGEGHVVAGARQRMQRGVEPHRQRVGSDIARPVGDQGRGAWRAVQLTLARCEHCRDERRSHLADGHRLPGERARIDVIVRVGEWRPVHGPGAHGHCDQNASQSPFATRRGAGMAVGRDAAAAGRDRAGR